MLILLLVELQRQDSVLKGLEKANKYKLNKVIIHDAVRPFFSNKTLNKIVTQLDHFDCVVPSLKIFDSVRHYEKKFTGIDRDKLKLIQTPQDLNSILYSVLIKNLKMNSLLMIPC